MPPMEPPSDLAAFRERLYAQYRRTHPAGAAAPSQASLRYDAKIYRRTFGPLLPHDRDAAVFDAGCGAGTFLHYLQHSGYAKSEGMDRDPEQAEAARKLGLKASAGDAFAHLASRPGAYDCVVAIDVLEHLTKGELFDALDAVRGALKPGGVFVWRAPNADGPFAGRIRYGDLTHELAFTAGSARQLMAAAGFDEVGVSPEGPVVTGLRSLVRAVLWTGFRAAARLYLFAESMAHRDCILTANLIVRARRPSL